MTGRGRAALEVEREYCVERGMARRYGARDYDGQVTHRPAPGVLARADATSYVAR